MLLGDLRGQKLRQHIAAGIERALHGAHDELIRYTVRQPVERQYPPVTVPARSSRSKTGFVNVLRSRFPPALP